MEKSNSESIFLKDEKGSVDAMITDADLRSRVLSKGLDGGHTLGIPTLMLTAHALSPDNLKKSIELGADAYIPKDKMVDISMYVEDVLISRQGKRKNNFKWYTKLRPLFDDFFGEGWKDPEKQLWDAFDKKHVESQ